MTTAGIGSHPQRQRLLRTRRKTLDAIALLREDHAKVLKMFEEYERIKQSGDHKKVELANMICRELTVHAMIEEEIFYPAVREALPDEPELLDEALVEHRGAKQLIAQIEGEKGAHDEMYDAKVKVLGEYIKHHVKEEQNEMFPKARKTELDLKVLGEQLNERKEEIQQKFSAQ